MNWCVMCRNNCESTQHLFNECPMAISFYRRVALILDVRMPDVSILHGVDAISPITDKKYTEKERSILVISPICFVEGKML